MEQVILCEGAATVAINSDGRRTVLSISNDEELLFPLSKHHLREILDGHTIQFSQKGVFCRLTRNDEEISIVYAWKGVHEHAICDTAKVEAFYCHLEANESAAAS